MNMWARLAPRMSDFEFHAASRDGHGADWPIGYADLAPYYDRVEDVLGLDGEVDGLAQLPDGRYRAPHPFTDEEREFRRKVEARWPDRRVIQARVIRQQLRQPPLPLLQAEATGRLTLRPNSVVRRIVCDANSGRATGVEFADRISTRLEEVRGRHVFLCASAFESVRILLNSHSTRHPHGIGGTSGTLGRYIADHLFLRRNGRVQSDRGIDPVPVRDPFDFADSHGFYIPSFRNIEGPSAGFAPGYGLCGSIGRVGPVWWMGVFGEMLTRKQNRITLSPTKRDTWGVPAAHIEFTLGANDRALIADAQRTLDEIIDAAGLARRSFDHLKGLVERRSFNDGVARPGLAIHEIGGARMGSDPASSVVDPLCRCWDAPNVIVSDGACFASGGYQNPALTIMALSVRAAEGVVRSRL